MLHLADKVIDMYEKPEEFEQWLDKIASTGTLVMESKTESNGRPVWRIRGITGAVISPSYDPLTNLVMLGFAFFGELWPFLPDADDAFKKVKKWWRKQAGKK